MLLVCGGTVSLSNLTMDIEESSSGGTPTATVTATLTGHDCGDGQYITVVYDTTAGSAASGSDYSSSSATVTLGVGVGLSTSQPIQIAVVNDLIDEGPETFTLSLSGQTSGTALGSTSSTTITILDDDAAPKIAIGSPASFTEGGAGTTNPILIPVNLIAATGTVGVVAGGTITVEYTIAAVTASTPADFSGTLTGTLTFNPGVGTANIPLSIIGDGINETDETLSITLSSPTNATLATPSTTLIAIPDDDGTNPVQIPGGVTGRPAGDANLLQSFCEPCEEEFFWGSIVNLFNGSFRIDAIELLDTGSTGGSDSSTSNDYASDFALPIYQANTMGLVNVDVIYTVPNTSEIGIPLYYSLEVTLNDAAGTPITTLPYVYYDPSGAPLTAGQQLVMSTQLHPSQSPPTGYYTYDAKVVGHYASDTVTNETSGSMVVVNRRESPYGAGWWIEGLDQVYKYDEGLAVVRADGSAAWFPLYDSGEFTTIYMPPAPGYYVSAEASTEANLITLVTKYNEKYEFDLATGKLKFSYDPAGNKTTFTHGAYGVELITDSFGRSIDYGWSGNVLQSVTDDFSRTVSFSIDSGKLELISFPDPGPGDAPEFIFDYYSGSGAPHNGFLKYITTQVQNDPDLEDVQRSTELLYDATGRLSEARNPDYSADHLSRWLFNSAYATTMEYMINGAGDGLTSGDPTPVVRWSQVEGSYSDELGATTTYKFENPGVVESISREIVGRSPITTIFDRDGNGLVTMITESDPDGGGDLDALSTVFTYDARGNRLSQTNPDESVLTWTYDNYDDGYSKFGIPKTFVDEEERQTTFVINSSTGLIESVIREVDSPGNDITTSYTYTDGPGGVYSDDNSLPIGLVRTVTEELTSSTTAVTTFTYYSDLLYRRGRLASTSRDAAPEESEDSDIITETFDYDARGFLKSHVDGMGNRTDFLNDNLGRVAKITEPYPDATDYDQIDNSLGSPQFTMQSAWDLETGSGFANNYRTLAEGDGNYAEWNFVDLVPGTTYEVFATWVDQISGATMAQFTTNGEIKNIAATVDQNADPVADDPFTDDSTKWKSLGTVTVDDDSFTLRLAQNSGGRVAADAVRIVQARPETTLSYNALGDLLLLTDPLGNETEYVYDLMSRPIEVTEPNPGSGAPASSFTYDPAGNVRTITNPLGAITEYQYDAFGRLARSLAPYPAAKGGAAIDDALASVSDPGHWAPEGSGRYATNGGGTKTIQWTFSGLTTDQPYEVLVNWDPNSANSTAAPYVVNNGTENKTIPVNQQIAPPTVAVLGGSWKSLGTFTPTGTTLTVTLSNSVADRVFAGTVRIEPRTVTAYTYDDAHNLQTITDPLGNITTYEYDNRHRLIKITEPPAAYAEPAPVTQFGYYKDSQLRYVADPLNRRTRYEYGEFTGWLERVYSPHPDLTSAAMTIIDDIDPEDDGFDKSASWVETSGGYGGDHHYVYGGGGGTADAITWTFDDLEDGLEYEVFVTWVIDEDAEFNDESAEFAVTFGGVANMSIDQSVEPIHGDIFNDGKNWQRLGVWTLGTEQDLVVSLTEDSSASVRVIADAVRVVKKGPVISYTYDQAGNVDTVTDPLGKVTNYDYDKFHRLITVTEPNPGYGGTPVWRYEYDQSHNLIKATDPFTKVTDYGYDGLGRLLSVELPDPDGDGTSKYTTRPKYRYNYDARGQVLRYTDPLGEQTSYGYDALQRLTEVTLPKPALAPNNPTITYAYDIASNLTDVTEKIDDNTDRTTRYVYDAWGRVTSTVLPDPDDGNYDVSNPTYRTVFDVAGNVIETFDARGNKTEYQYDDLLRLTKEILPDPDAGSQLSPYTEYEYDLAGQVEAVISALVATSGGGTHTKRTEYLYDRLGRMTEVHLPNKDTGVPANPPKKHVYEYDAVGNALSWTDPLLQVTNYAYDGLHRLTQRQDPDPDDNGVTNGPLGRPTVSYTYDLVGNLKNLTDPNDNVTEFSYDALQRLDKETIELEGAAERFREYTYDDAGQLVTRIDRNGRMVTYDYDELGQLRFEKWFTDDEDTTANNVIEYGYNFVGDVELARSNTGDDSTWESSLAYTYDFLSRAEGIAIVNDNDSSSGVTDLYANLAYTFDADGYRDTFSATIGASPVTDFINDYTFDPLGRLTVLTQTKQVSGVNEVADKRVEFAYRADGQFSTITRFASTASDTGYDVIQSTYGYDDIGRLTSLDHVDVAEVSTPVPRAKYDWVYDDFNRLTDATEEFNNTGTPDRDIAHTYDDNGQLKRTIVDLPSPTPDIETYYDYDEAGNRTGNGHDTGKYNRVKSDGTYTYRYDDEGNQTSRTLIDGGTRETMTWDHRNRLTSITTQVPREVAHWRFDGDATNATGNSALDGTLVGGASFSGNGAPLPGNGGSLLLDDDYVTMGNQDELKLRDRDFSIALWFNVDTDVVQGLAGQGGIGTGEMGYAILYWGSSTPKRVEIRVNDGSGSSQNLAANTTSLANGWHHFAATIDRDGNLSVYLDGELANSTAFTQTVNADIVGSTAFVGGAYGGGTSPFEGEIDELRVWHQVLSAADVTALNSSADPLYDSATPAYVGPTKKVDYGYDAFDRRILKRVNLNAEVDDDIIDTGEGASQYVYDGDDIVLAFDKSATLTNRYLHGPAVDQILADEQYGAVDHTDPSDDEGIVYWPLADNLGSVRQLVTSDGAEAKRINYDSYGQMTVVNGAAIDHIFGYTGREHDAESHLQFNRARYYDPALGRWISEDPIGFAAGDANVGRYVGNSPTNSRDPSGMAEEFNPYQMRWEIDGIRAFGYTDSDKMWDVAINGHYTVLKGDPNLVRELMVIAAQWTDLKNLAEAHSRLTNPTMNPRERLFAQSLVRQMHDLELQAIALLRKFDNPTFSIRYWDDKYGVYQTRTWRAVEESPLSNFQWIVEDKSWVWILKPPPGNPQLDGLQNGLDLLSYLPGVGAGPGLINAAISAMRGNWKDAGMRLVDAGASYVGGRLIGAGISKLRGKVFSGWGKPGPASGGNSQTSAGAMDAGGRLNHANAAGNPSTLQPGPYAKESIPGHSGKPTAAEQARINEMMQQHGCHTCGTTNPGTKSGNAIVDHQPPEALGEPIEFYPHCINCMRRQGGQVRQQLQNGGGRG